MNNVEVACIIVTWNKRSEVCLLIDNIKALNLQQIKLDIYVVDNASTDGTQAYIEKHYSSNVNLIQTGENLGGSGGFSLGLQIVSQLEYDYLWLLDDDVCLDPLTLSALVETLQNYEQIGLVGSQIRKRHQPQIIQELGSQINEAKAHLKTNFANLDIASVETILRAKPYLLVDVCAAASVLIRRKVVQQIGVFEDYFLHFDDVEWCLRAKQAGWLVAVNSDSIVWHDSPDFKCRPWIHYYDDRNLCYCWQKHRPELLLKRVLVRLPKLIYYAATGRYFLTEISIAGFQDFLQGIRGKTSRVFNDAEVSLERIVTASVKGFVQPVLFQDPLQSQMLEKLQTQQKLVLWQPHKSLSSRLWLWCVAWFWKPIEIALVDCEQPDLYVLNLAKQVYCFTGKGYTPISINPITLVQAVVKTAQQMWQIYWQTRKQKQLATPNLMVNPLTPLVSIIICTTDRHSVLNKALESLEKIQYPKFEIIVIDASSSIETSSTIDTFSRKSNLKLKSLKVERKNISYSRNVGVRLASGAIVAFFDDDAIPPADWIQQLLATYAQRGEKCAAVGGAVRDLSHCDRPLQFHRGMTNLISETVSVRSSDAADHNQPNGFWFNGLMGTNSSFRKDLLEKINGYDEFFDYFLDETDVCLRLIQAGYEVHYANVTVDHYPQPSHNRVDQKHLTCWHTLAKNTTYFSLKHGFKKIPFPVLASRLTLLLIYRCLLRILRLKFTHRLPTSAIMHYISQSLDGIRIGWKAGLNIHNNTSEIKLSREVY